MQDSQNKYIYCSFTSPAPVPLLSLVSSCFETTLEWVVCVTADVTPSGLWELFDGEQFDGSFDATNSLLLELCLFLWKEAQQNGGQKHWFERITRVLLVLKNRLQRTFSAAGKQLTATTHSFNPLMQVMGFGLIILESKESKSCCRLDSTQVLSISYHLLLFTFI